MSQDDLIPIGKLVPLGKHKGQPLEVLRGDPETQQWWRDHPSVAARHPYVINFINMFGEPSPTPVHNRFQIDFLNEDLRRRTFSRFAQERILRRADLYQLASKTGEGPFLLHQIVETGPPTFECEGVDVQFSGQFALQIRSKTEGLGLCSAVLSGEIELLREYPHFVAFEESGTLRAELKPLLGDDYPAVLRSMCSKKANCLIYDSYDGCVSYDQLKQFFASRGITALHRTEIEDVHLPTTRANFWFG